MIKLKKEQLELYLVGKSFSFLELDMFMEACGYYGESGNGYIEDIRRDESCVYVARDSCMAEVIVRFDVIGGSDETECVLSFDIKVVAVDSI